MDMRDRTRQWRIRKNRTACILNDVDLFSECTVKQLRAVAQLVCPIAVKRDRVIVRAGDCCDQLVFVLSGEAVTRAPNRDADVLGAGAVFGEQALLPGSVEIATVTATTPMELLVASQVELREMVRIAPSIEPRLLAGVARQSPAVQPEAVEVGRTRGPQVVFTA